MSVTGLLGSRRSLLAVLCAVLMVIGTWSLPSSGFAQEPEEGAAPAQAGGGGGESNVAVADEGFGATLIWIAHTSGMIGLFLFCLSIYFVSVVTKLMMTMKLDVALPPTMVQQCDDHIQKKDFMGLFNLVKGDQSLFSRMLSTGINELQNGLSEARETMAAIGEVAHADYEQKISILAVIGSLGPMIGLLGTLKGMIASFSVIARSDTQLKASEVAGGISEALLLTFEGVLLAAPAIFFFSFFKARALVMSVNTLSKADDYLRHFAHAARKKSPAAPAPANAPAPPAPAKPQ
jgi:biopolymer transport protein ExbB